MALNNTAITNMANIEDCSRTFSGEELQKLYLVQGIMENADPEVYEMFPDLKLALSLLKEITNEETFDECLLPELELSPETVTKVQELEDEKADVRRRKSEFDQEENKKIHNIEEQLDQPTLDEVKEERSQKRKGDRAYNEQIADIDAQIKAEEQEGLKEAQEIRDEALMNTLNEGNRKANRSSDNSNTPSSQQGFDRTDAEPSTGKRGAPKGHAGYVFDVGFDPKTASREELEELSQTLPIQIVDLMPESIPEGAEIKDGARRIAFGIEKSPIILVYNQKVAVAKDKDNPRKKIIEKGEFPEWLTKSYTYCPEYRTEALQLRLTTHTGYKNIADLMRQGYGYNTINAQTVGNWVHEAAADVEKVAEQIKEELRQAPTKGADETGIREHGKTKWAYVTTNSDYTWITVSEHRGFEGIEENGVLINAKEGTIITHDDYAIYHDDRLKQLKHGICWEHKKRKGEEIKAFESENAAEVEELFDWFYGSVDEREKLKEAGEKAFDPAVLHRIKSEFEDIVERGLKNNPKKKVLYKRKTKSKVIRSAMKRILRKGEAFFDFLQNPETIPVPWIGCELSGKKNPPQIVELSQIAAEIDKEIAIAVKTQKPIPPETQQKLQESFTTQVKITLSAFSDSTTQFNYKTKPDLQEETTQAFKFFHSLREHKNEALLFLHDFSASITNNVAEQAIRVLKLIGKTSGSFRGNAKDHAALISYISSAKKQGLSALQAIRELVASHPEFLFDKEPSQKEQKPIVTTIPRRKVE